MLYKEKFKRKKKLTKLQLCCAASPHEDRKLIFKQTEKMIDATECADAVYGKQETSSETIRGLLLVVKWR